MRNSLAIGSLFENEPHPWGLRGDPYLWQEMKRKFKNVPLPETPEELKVMIETEFELITGRSVSESEDCLVEQFSHGGMSSGYISMEFWHNSAIPELLRRFIET